LIKYLVFSILNTFVVLYFQLVFKILLQESTCTCI